MKLTNDDVEQMIERKVKELQELRKEEAEKCLELEALYEVRANRQGGSH